MNRRTKWIATGAVAVAALGIGSGIAVASDGDADPIPSKDLERATAVALEHTGGGHVTGSEVGDEEGAYEVEVTLDDGSKVDVHLDSSFKVIDAKPDSPNESASEGPSEGK
jgi:hypothetical protein